MNMHSTDGGYTVWGSTLHIDVDNVSIHLIIGIFIGVPIYCCTVPHTQIFSSLHVQHWHATRVLGLYSRVAAEGQFVDDIMNDRATIYTEDIFCPWAFGHYPPINAVRVHSES